MCHRVFLSTDSPADLRRFDAEGLAFQIDRVPEDVPLRYDHRWYVASASGCSCDFRHQMGCNVVGGLEIVREPADWFPEDPQAVAATRRFVHFVRELLAQGWQVDCFDQWDDGGDAEWLASVVLPMDRIRDQEFSFIEGCYHRFV
jgi:hypothetical protein